MSNRLFVEDYVVDSADIFVTEKCNLNCSYCFHKQSPATLDLEKGKQIIDKLHEAFPKVFSLTFFGGEPLLYPELVLELAKYALSLWGEGNIGFSVTTNCTYFDKAVFEEFKKLHFRFCLSFDGTKETTLLHRRGSDFEKIVGNIKEIVIMFPDSTIRMTFTPETVGRLAMNVQFVHELGARIIMPHAVMEADWTEESVRQYTYQLKQLYHYRRFMIRRGRPVDIVSIDKTMKILNDELPPERNFCEAGKCYISILPSGDVYPCHRAASNRQFRLGNIFEGMIIRGMFLTIDKEASKCVYECSAHPVCHTCLMVHYLINKAIAKPCKSYCEIVKAEYQLAREYLPVELSDRRDRQLEQIAQQNDLIIQGLSLTLKEK